VAILGVVPALKVTMAPTINVLGDVEATFRIMNAIGQMDNCLSLAMRRVSISHCLQKGKVLGRLAMINATADFADTDVNLPKLLPVAAETVNGESLLCREANT
jgi:hypothetical protein